MTTHGNLAAKKRAYGNAFAPSMGSATASSAASASLYDFDDIDTPISKPMRRPMIQPKSLATARQLTTPAKKNVQASRTAAATASADPVPSPTKPSAPVKKTRPPSAVLSSAATKHVPTASDATKKAPERPSAPQRSTPSLARSSTAPSAAKAPSQKPAKLVRSAFSDPYDLPMDDAPPPRRPSLRALPIQTVAETSASRQSQPSRAAASKPAVQLSPKQKAQQKPPLRFDAPKTKPAVKLSGRIDSYFTKPSMPMAASAKAPTTLQNAPELKPQQLAPAPVFKSPTKTTTPKSYAARTPSRPVSRAGATTPRLNPKSPARSPRVTTKSPRASTAKSPRVAPMPKSARDSNPPNKRRRLIDTLAAQAEDDMESSSDSSSDSSDDERMEPPSVTSTPIRVSEQRRPPILRSGLSMRSHGPRVTYAMQRSILADPRESDPNHDPFALPLLTSVATPTKEKDSFDFDDGPESDDEALPKGAIRSVHELRMAGANNRFADQMDDLFDRVGEPTPNPTSMRRNALLEVASRINEKAFSRQFRDYGAESRLFAKIGQETDTVSGFALIATLLTLMSSASVPHVLALLQEHKVTNLLERLLQTSESITELAQQRQTNLSRVGKTTVATLKTEISKLSIWKGSPVPKDLSPRTLTLKFMDLYCKPADLGNYVVSSKSMGDTLFSILHRYCDHEWREDATLDEKLDCQLAASILGAHAMGFEHSDLALHWNTNHMPIVVAVVDVVLSKGKFGAFENAVLRLALNMSNNNPGAANSTGILAFFKSLCASIHSTFETVKAQFDTMDFTSEFSPFTKLLLMLGTAINFCEHCPPVRHSVDDWVEEGSPVDGLIELFLQSHMATYQADSVEKTQLNVGFGYLSILLAYLCLARPVRRKLEARSAGRGLSDLRDTVREFMILQGKVDGGKSGGDHMRRIQNLLNELEMGI